MRSAGNFHPEWGYLAPAPSFMRTIRIALVATAIGAVAGAAVVVSLVERPGNHDNAIAAHALLNSRAGNFLTCTSIPRDPRGCEVRIAFGTVATSTRAVPGNTRPVNTTRRCVTGGYAVGKRKRR